MDNTRTLLWAIVVGLAWLRLNSWSQIDIPLEFPLTGDVLITDSSGVRFRWRAVPGATHYRLQVSDRANFSRLYVDAQLQQRSGWIRAIVRGLRRDGVYWWRVQAINTSGLSIWSPSWQFVLGQRVQIPQDLVPSEGCTLAWNSAVRLSWHAAIEAHRYALEVSCTKSFDSVVFRVEVPTAFVTLYDLKPGNVYFWRVRAFSTAGDRSPWSAIAHFRLAPLPTPQEEILQRPMASTTSAERNRPMVRVASDSLTGSITLFASEPLDGRVQLYDVVGRKVVELSIAGATQVTIPGTRLAVGSYVLVATTRGHQWVAGLEVLQ